MTFAEHLLDLAGEIRRLTPEQTRIACQGKSQTHLLAMQMSLRLVSKSREYIAQDISEDWDMAKLVEELM